jgi:hypothetical protein
MFRELSVNLTKQLDKTTKQSQGIFFTPKSDRDRMFELLKEHVKNPKSILEPSFGSGEFLEDLYEQFPKSKITGVELNETLFASSSRPNLYNTDFLSYTGKHDLIVGNPPFVVIKKTNDTEKCQSGRPNLFVQFVYKSIAENLVPNGVVAFVLPTSFFNCGYYERCRKWLYDKTTILDAKRLEGNYLETQQDTFALIVRNAISSKKDFFLELGGHIYLAPLYKELTELVKNTHTLSQLGYLVKTGEVVWNQEKDKLNDEGTLLIYSSNFTKGELVLGNLKTPKNQYIRGVAKTALSGKSVLINRGYGNTSYTINSVLVDLPAYYCENHVNVIRATDNPKCSIETILKSLQNKKTAEFIRLFVGNGALSKTELEECLPIWTDED